MEVSRTNFVTVTMTEQEAHDLYWAIPEVLAATQQPVFDGGYPWNWRTTDRGLKALYNKLKPAEWGELV